MTRFAAQDFGNPSSAHLLGRQAAKALIEARKFFADQFQIKSEQVIFTGSGSESDNLAIYGVALDALAKGKKGARVITSASEHAAVKKSVQSLESLGFDVQLAPLKSDGQIDEPRLLELINPNVILVSIHRVNNILGTLIDVENLARLCKQKQPSLIFHSDCVQAFGKVDLPKAGSAVDLISLSAHKIQGPKGIGALIVLNPTLIKAGLRPLIWGGDQEMGLRSGTQSSGLIAGFHIAAQKTLNSRQKTQDQMELLRQTLQSELKKQGLLDLAVRWNSPSLSIPNIVNLSVIGVPSTLVAQMLEEDGCIVSTGSACSSKKAEPDSVLTAMGCDETVCSSALRVSFCKTNRPEDVVYLVQSLGRSIKKVKELLSA